MQFDFTGICALRLEHSPGMTTSKHVATDFRLELSENLDKKVYLDSENLPTAAGSHALTNIFIQGIIANIHTAHANGFRNDAEHLRYVISELERGFIENVKVSKSFM